MSQVSLPIDDLRVLPCLSYLTGEDYAAIEGMAEMRTESKNATLFLEGDPVEFFFVVKSGTIKLFKSSPGGRDLLIRKMGPGDYFCCAPIYASSVYYVSAMAVKDSVLVALPAQEFKSLLSSSFSEMGLRMMRSLCGRIKYLSELVEDLTFKNVEQRVMIAIWRSAEEVSPGKKVVTLSLTHQEIASITGTVREVVSRAMLKLKKDHVIIESSINGFTVDRGKLMALLREPWQPMPSR